MASVFLTYALQQSTGRIILWAAYISSLALTIMNSIVTFQGIAEAINEAFANGRYNPAPLQGLQSQQNPLQLLTIIPTLVFALAFYQTGTLHESTTPYNCHASFPKTLEMIWRLPSLGRLDMTASAMTEFFRLRKESTFIRK